MQLFRKAKHTRPMWAQNWTMRDRAHRWLSVGNHRARRVVVAAISLLFPLVISALAHPMGNFSINSYCRLHLVSGQLEIRYIVDMAEIPTFQELTKIDLDQDKTVSDEENRRYLDQKVSEFLQGLQLKIDGRPASMRLDTRALSFPPGQGGLPTLRIDMHLLSPLSSWIEAGTHTIEFEDKNYGDRIGWKEMVATADGFRILESNVPQQDRSQELTNYPNDLSSPPRMTAARVRFEPGEGVAAGSSTSLTGGLVKSRNLLAELVARDKLQLDLVLLSLVVAVGLGATHALSPGHGKTIVAAYLVGSRGTAKHAALLGLTVTATHTFGVYALGLITLFASKYILPETLYPWLGFFSGLTVLIIGATLFVRRYRLARIGMGHEHDHHHGHHHHHHHEHAGDDLDSTSPAAHSHDHGHQHGHEGALHEGHSSHHGHHHHLPQGEVTVRSLLALGVSGGIVPCPSALVVLLAAISLHRIGFGLILIVAFSCGLAGVLIGIGLLMVYARQYIDRFTGHTRLFRTLPIFSSAVIVVLGAAIALQSLASGGLIRVPFLFLSPS